MVLIKVDVMKYEFITHTLNPLRNIFWYLIPGITVSWVLSDKHVYTPLSYFDYMFTDTLGNWLTNNVGKQGIHWDWRYSRISDEYCIHVKIIKSRQEMASLLLLRWR